MFQLKLQLEDLSDEIKGNVTVEVIGRTKEYQDIVLLKITQANNKSKNVYFRADDDRYADEKPEKKIIFIVHGLSVMGMKKLECLSYEPSFLQLVSFYLKHLDKFDIFLMPMANPDGYAFLQVSIFSTYRALLIVGDILPYLLFFYRLLYINLPNLQTSVFVYYKIIFLLVQFLASSSYSR